jgi:Rps23 Pro-64 3,4-dihydroxylase Tpa1-like proline 4-hydroxylase
MFNIQSEVYQSTKPFPYVFIDNFLDIDFAKDVQNEIISIPNEHFDRYDNPFEKKYTLRDKYNFPENLNKLMNQLTSQDFIHELSKLTGYNLINDPDRNFWGVHKYRPGDKLDIHVDAGVYQEFKKQVTLGIYFSYNWQETYGCDLELWEGDNSAIDNPKIYNCVTKIAPIFNRLIIFTCDDNSWHGNPEPMTKSDSSAMRIFVTLSYLSDNQNFQNKRQKAYFISRPFDSPDKEKDKLRLLRANPEKCKDVYVV